MDDCEYVDLGFGSDSVNDVIGETRNYKFPGLSDTSNFSKKRRAFKHLDCLLETTLDLGILKSLMTRIFR